MQQLHTGTTLQNGRYKILSVLGQGGFGITYLACQTMLERKVAIKEFFMKELCERSESTGDVTLGTNGSRDIVNRFRDKFLKEARNISKLNHPNIIRIIDVFEENGTAYYVMEYAENGSLSDKLKRCGYLSEPEATRYILQVAEALKYIHQRKMNHLDVKPANIMLNEKDECVLIDFGVAKQYDATTSEGTTTTPVGISHGYSPAEQYRKNGVQTFSPQSDVYALAATLFKILTGNTPPEAIEVQEEGIPEEYLTERHITQQTIAAIKAAMKSRRSRTQTINEFIEALCSTKNDTKVIDIQPIPSKYNTDEATLLFEEISQSDLHDKTFTVGGVSFTMKAVAGGTFTMGATSEQGGDAFDDEKPTHRVTLSDYYIGQTEVTQALWQAVMGSNPSESKGSNLPVERVSWDDCQEFIRKLNSMTGQKFRLPTEAEWEYAARGGNKSKGYKYSGSNNIESVAWYGGNSGYDTHPVATKQPNELGIYDMSGNVWEWCQDWYGSYSSGSQTNPTGPSSGSCRVNRGSGWLDLAMNCRVSDRNFITPDIRSVLLGLRLALSD